MANNGILNGDDGQYEGNDTFLFTSESVGEGHPGTQLDFHLISFSSARDLFFFIKKITALKTFVMLRKCI